MGLGKIEKGLLGGALALKSPTGETANYLKQGKSKNLTSSLTAEHPSSRSIWTEGSFGHKKVVMRMGDMRGWGPRPTLATRLPLEGKTTRCLSLGREKGPGIRRQRNWKQTLSTSQSCLFDLRSSKSPIRYNVWSCFSRAHLWISFHLFPALWRCRKWSPVVSDLVDILLCVCVCVCVLRN